MKPICKAVGGKQRLCARIRDELPNVIKGRLIEPFFGGGAVFFDYLDGPHVDDGQPIRALVNDANPALMNFYRAIATNPRAVHTVARELLDQHFGTDGVCTSNYYQVREDFNIGMPKLGANSANIALAGAFAYLNRACFNGLWRVNKGGDFNVPRGQYRTIGLPPVEEYEHAARMLAGATILTGNYAIPLGDARHGDVVYADPPYIDTFVGYATGGFDAAEHHALASRLRDAARKGAHVLLSINDCKLARELYDDGTCVLREVVVRHAVGATEERRKDVGELLVHVRV